MLLLVGLADLVACDARLPSGVVVSDGDAGIQVDTQGNTVTYSWSGGGARLLEVRNLDAQEVVWRIVARQVSDGGFQPPVSHGSAPAEADVEVPPTIVVTGERHQITVELVGGTATTESFTP